MIDILKTAQIAHTVFRVLKVDFKVIIFDFTYILENLRITY